MLSQFPVLLEGALISAYATEETSQPRGRMSAVWGTPDSTRTSSLGRFWPIADMGLVDSPNGIYGIPPGRSVDFQTERFDDRRPKSDIGCKRLPEFFGA